MSSRIVYLSDPNGYRAPIGPLTERSQLHPEALNANDLRIGMMIMSKQGFDNDPLAFYLVLDLPYVDTAGITRARMFNTYHPDTDTDPEAVLLHPGYGFLAANYALDTLGLAPYPARHGRPAYWALANYSLRYEPDT